MPGRRNLQRERAEHARSSPAHQAELYRQLHTHLPHAEVALIGQQPILSYLHRLGLRRLNGRPLHWRFIARWRRTAGCPILRGFTQARHSASPLTTNHALTAWILTRFHAADLFIVVPTQGVTPSVQLPRITQRKAA